MHVCEFSKAYVYDLSIFMLLIIPQTWCLKKKSRNAFIMKCYTNYEFSVWCISMKCFRTMSSSDLNSVSRGYLLAFHGKCYLIGHKVGLVVVLAFIGYGQLMEEVNWPPWLKICIMMWSWEYLALWGMLDA